MLSQEEKENLETCFQQRFRRQTNITWCRVKCISVFSDASFLSCKTLHVKFWIILMLYSQTMSCILVLLNVSKAEEKERRLASTIESMQASHMLPNTTLRSRFGQSASVTKKSETIAYFATPVLNPPRLIDFLQADKEKLEKLLETAKQEVRVPGSRPRNMWCSTRADGVHPSWSIECADMQVLHANHVRTCEHWWCSRLESKWCTVLACLGAGGFFAAGGG